MKKALVVDLKVKSMSTTTTPSTPSAITTGSSTGSSGTTTSSSLVLLLNNEYKKPVPETSIPQSDAMSQSSVNERENLKAQIDILIETYLSKVTAKSMVDTSSDTSSSNSSNGVFSSIDEVLIQCLFDLLAQTKHKDIFKRVNDELDSNQMKKNLFISISKVAHELFELGYFDSSERLLEFTINEIDTCSLLLKMSTLSTLSACYWKQSKFSESIRCMNLEFNLVSHLNDSQNKYRILGNIANAYQLLNNFNEAKNYFKLQLSISLKMKNRVLTIHSLNSLGNLHLKCKELDKALECYNKSLSLIQMLPATIQQSEHLKKHLFIKQYSLIGDCYLKLNQPQKSRSYFMAQLEAAYSITDENEDEHLINICKSKLNLALIETKLNHCNESIAIYEDLLKKYFTKYKFSNLSLIEIYFKINICLLNTCIRFNKIPKAVAYAQSLLEFSLSEQNKYKFKLLAKQQQGAASSVLPSEAPESNQSLKFYKYLKFIELCSCSKLASCYSKLNNLTDAAKLYERELKLAKYLNNLIYITRSYSHLAQINFLKKNYNKCIVYYKEILNLIKANINSSSPTTTTSDNNNEKRLLQMTYYTLSNLGLCMEILNRLNDAYLLFIEQYEISKRLNNLKYNANALLNIINLYFKYEKNFYNQSNFIDDYTSSEQALFVQQQQQSDQQHKIIDNIDLKLYLYNLLDIYQELNDLNGELFISQCLAYYYHKNNLIKLAVKFYLHSIEICKLLNNKLSSPNHAATTDNGEVDKVKLNKKLNFYSNTNTLEKTLFNLSLCYRYMRKYQEAYKYQLEYLYLVKMKNFKYSEFVSLGIIADLLLEIQANYDDCIKIHISRLRLVQDNLRRYTEQQNDAAANDEELQRYNSELEYFTLKRCKLIADCLSSIAKCYFLFHDYQQVYKFKLMEFKLRIQDEQQSSVAASSTEATLKQFNKQKFKILLDLGNLLLFKLSNHVQALYYYEYAYKVCKLHLDSDMILSSLALGNIGICKLKLGEYELAINFFKQQIEILNEKLKLVKLPEQEQQQNQKLNLSSLNLKQILKHKEYILVYLDIGRSYSKLSKCYENLNLNNPAMNLFEDEALNYLVEYLNICEMLFNRYCRDNDSTTAQQEASSEHNNNNSDESVSGDLVNDQNEIHEAVHDVCEQIKNDYDLSLYKLAKFYVNQLKRQPKEGDESENIIQLAINLHKGRLSIQQNLLQKNESAGNAVKILNKVIEINLMIANLYHKLNNSNNSCFTYLLNIINLVNKTFKKQAKQLNRILYVQALVFYFKLTFKSKEDLIVHDYRELLNYAYDQYLNDSWIDSDEKHLQLRFELVSCISRLYLKLNLARNAVNFIRQALLQFESIANDRVLEVLFKLNFKLAMIQIVYENSSSDSAVASSNESGNDTIEIREKTVNAALSALHTAESYLNDEKFQLVKHLYEFRLANLFYYKGLAYKELKNFATSLEMFASALDLFENFDKSMGSSIEDMLDDEESQPPLPHPESFFDTKIDLLYELIEDLLIKMNKLKEALLVTERHRSKFNAYLTKHADIVQFEQIEAILMQKNPLAVIYFHLLKFNSTINCWLLEPGLGITKFHQISFKSLNSLLLLNDEKNFNFMKQLIDSPASERSLKQAYSVLIKPFELNLFNWFYKSDTRAVEEEPKLTDVQFRKKLVLIYDEHLFTVPFHLLKIEIQKEEFSLSQVFDISSLYSLKQLFATSKANLNFKYVPNEVEFENLVEQSKNTTGTNRLSFKLIAVNFINETSDFKQLNYKVNQIMSSNMAQTVLLNLKFNTSTNSAYSSSLFTETILNEIRDLNANEEKVKTVDGIYVNLVRAYKQHFQNQLPYCFLFGKNVNLFAKRDEQVQAIDESENECIMSTMCQIIQLNCKTVNNSLVNLLLYLLATYLDKIDQASKIVTTSENIEKRLNLQENDTESLILFKRLLKQLGFVFMDPFGKNLVRFPNQILASRLELIHKCLLFVSNIPANVLTQLCTFTKTMGREFLRLLAEDYEEFNSCVALIVDYDKYTRFREFFNEIQENIKIIDNRRLHIEVNLRLFGNVNFLLILLFENNENMDLSRFIDEFTNEDTVSAVESKSKDVPAIVVTPPAPNNNSRVVVDDDEASSEYSTLSSILGLQSKNIVRDINLEYDNFENTKRSSEHPQSSLVVQSASTSTINDEISQYANRMHKMIEINVDTESEIAVYDRYLSQLLDNDLSSLHQQQQQDLLSSATATPRPSSQQQKANEILDLEKTIDEECKWTCLLQYEEEERVNKLITTVTTRTITEDMLCYDNNRLCLNDSIGDELDDDPINTNNATIATSSNNASIPIIAETSSDGIYSSLVNYTTSPSPSSSAKLITIALTANEITAADDDDDDVSELTMFKKSSTTTSPTTTTTSSSSSNYDSGCYSSAARNYKLVEYITDDAFA